MSPELEFEKIFRGPRTKKQKDGNIYFAHLAHGYTLKEIADYLGIHYTSISKKIAQGEEVRK